MDTMATGIRAGQPHLHGAMNEALKGASLGGLSVAGQVDVPKILGDGNESKTNSSAPGSVGGGKTVNFHGGINITLPNVTNAQDFKTELVKLIEGFDA